MVTVTVNADSSVATATFTDADSVTLARARAKHGDDVLHDVIAGWLADRARAQREADITLMQARFELLAPADQATIRDKLNAVAVPDITITQEELKA